MLYIIGLGLIGAGIAMIIRMYIQSLRPRIYDGRIVDVFMDFWEHPKYPGKLSPRKFKLARVEYFFESVKYEFTIILKSRKSQPGDPITLTIDPKIPHQVEQIYVKPELVAILILLGLGGGIIIGCHVLQDYLA